MLDSKIKSIIDNARDVLVGKVPNPQSQIDLITIAMIYKFMDDMDNSIIKAGGSPSFFKDAPEKKDEKKRPLTEEDNDRLGNLMSKYAWHKLLDTSLGNEDRLQLYSKALDRLQISKNIPQLFRQIFKGAFLPFRDGATLSLFLKEINKLSYDNSENLGNGFEYLLKVMGSQGDAGQFRTPRHIIDFIVDVVNPKKDNTILDPACGTAGFLISAFKHILKHNSEAFNPKTEIKSYVSSIEEEDLPDYNGDKLTPKERTDLTKHIKGYDISPDMQKLALVNLYLHGFRNPDIAEYDTLTQETKWKDTFDVILANPPFMTPKGGIKPHKKFSIQANRSEVLFVDYIVEHLNLNGKAGVIVPEGIIFQSQTAYKKLRKLIQENYLYAVVSLPSGVFQPYSNVKTSILFIDKEIAKKADSILFVNVKNDGYDLGAQRKPIKCNDLKQAYDVLKEYKTLLKSNIKEIEAKLSKYNIANLVPKSQIAEDGDYILSGSRYLETTDYSNCKWDMTKLSDICTFVRGPFGGSLKKEIFKQTGYLVYEQYHAINNDFSFGRYYIDDKKYKEMDRFRVSSGELIISCSGTMGKISIIPDNFKEGIINQALLKLSPQKDILNNKYLKYVLEDEAYQERYFRSELGAAIKNVTSVKELKEIEIPLPPLKVQEEIVKELEAYQSVIDGAKMIVESWKPTLPIDPHWEMLPLDKVCSKITDGSHFSPTTTDRGYPYVTVKDITGDTVDFEHCKFINENDYKTLVKNGCKPKYNDILFSKDGTVGKVSIVNYEKDFVVLSSLAIITPNQDIVIPMYLKHIMKSPAFVSAAVDNKTGVAIKRIVLKTLKTIKIPVPSIEEQKEIVAKIEEEAKAVAQCKKLIELHEQKISDKIKSIWGDSCS